MNTTKSSIITIHSMILISTIGIGIAIFEQVSVLASLSTSVFRHSLGLNATYLITVGVCLLSAVFIGFVYFAQRNKHVEVGNIALNALNFLSTIIAVIVTLAIFSVMSIFWALILVEVSKVFFIISAIFTVLMALAILVTFIAALVISITAIFKTISGENNWSYPSLSEWFFSKEPTFPKE